MKIHELKTDPEQFQAQTVFCLKDVTVNYLHCAAYDIAREQLQVLYNMLYEKETG